MKKYFTLLRQSELFQNIDDDIEHILTCLSARLKEYSENDIILLSGDSMTSIGMIVEGSALITKEDYEGNRIIISELKPGGIFAESLALSGVGKSPVTVVTTAGCKVLWINAGRISSPCESSCPFHIRLIKNLLTILSTKNLFLNSRIDILTQRSLRDKLIQFFNTQALANGNKEFEIGLTREELADFVFANRSAVSRELCAMREEGLITFSRNHFKLFF